MEWDNAAWSREVGKTLEERGFLGIAQKNYEIAGELERLRSDLRLCRNELCLRCGNYKLAHKGACDDCRWKDMGD